uniref:LysM domain-containing protein n=1 Tax=Tetradesmus obliquus TaxID=3088 RepID=A0A383VEF8_TETOB|eukprot:jgi/Sobl393_1/17443/SZX63320.1
MEGLSPSTDFSSFKPATAAYITDLSNLPLNASFPTYLTACKQPFIKFNQARGNSLQASLRRIVQVNAATKLKHVAGLNLFSQMSFADRAKYLGLRGPSSSSSSSSSNSAAQALSRAAEFLRRTARLNIAAAEAAADSFFAAAEEVQAASQSSPAQWDIPDWTVVLPGIKHQGACSSCWAFAAAAVTEAASYSKTGVVISLSEKQLVDCNTDNGGCDGGLYPPAFEYIISKGLTTAMQYPYVAQKGSCPPQLPGIASRLSNYTALPINHEAAMYQALKKGPLVVGVKADTPFLEYAGGVFTSATCAGQPNHAVVVVGAGTDLQLGANYWLIRNSWGESWGEGGYMRIARGSGSGSPGMCGIASQPYKVSSADAPLPPAPPAPVPEPGCQDTVVSVDEGTSLADIATQYNTTVVRIQLDNRLDDPSTKLRNGTKLNITCPLGVWSEPYGVWDNMNVANAMVAAPVEGNCPNGHYAVQFYIKPSQWFTGEAWTGSTWVGRITMTCSDGTAITIDAQPGFDAGWAHGSVIQPNGFPSVAMKTGWAVDSVLGVGAQSGGERLFSCPAGMLVTGIAGGANPEEYPKGWLSNLQLRCSNPFGVGGPAKARLGALSRASFPKVPFGLSCKTHSASSADTWQSIASKHKVLVNELIRSNPQMAGRVTRNSALFIPPCINGVVQGTKREGASTAFATAVDQKRPLKQAAAAAQRASTDAPVAEAAAAQLAAGADGK